MKGRDIIEGMGFVDEDLIEEAARAGGAGGMFSVRRRWAAAAAAVMVCALLSLPALAAAVPAVYDVLYAISPATAQLFKPVRMACEDNGIRMEVTAAYIHEDTAEIYVTLQDLTGNRFDETIDLFDSYDINTPFNCSGTCRLVECDAEAQTATFLILIEQWDGQRIEGDKITFSIGELLMNKKEWEGVIEGVDLTKAEEAPPMQRVHTVGMGGREIVDRYRNIEREEGIDVMTPGKAIASPTEGVSITGIGYVDGELRVQTRYELPLSTDNHGSVCLRDKATGEMVDCFGSLSFFDMDKEGKDRCDEEIFTGIDREELQNYELYGCFTTSEGAIEGNWEVTFPLEETATGK